MLNMPYYYLTSDYMGSLERLTDNKKIPLGTIDKKTASAVIEKNEDAHYIDYRLPAISIIKKSNTINYIYNYSMFFATVTAGNSVIRLYLDFGLIPIAFYPTSHDFLIDEVEENLEISGLKHFKVPARFNHGRKDVHKEMYDSWVSRIDAGKFLNCPPENVRMAELFKRVMNQ